MTCMNFPSGSGYAASDAGTWEIGIVVSAVRNIRRSGVVAGVLILASQDV